MTSLRTTACDALIVPSVKVSDENIFENCTNEGFREEYV